MFTNKKQWLSLMMIAVIFSLSMILSSCTADRKVEPEVKKAPVETKSSTSTSTSTKMVGKQILISGSSAYFGKEVVEDIYDPKDPNSKYMPNLKVYAACARNNFMNGDASSLWKEYEVKYDSLNETYVFNHPTSGQPEMFTLVQVIEGKNGANRINWLQLGAYFSSGYVYDNRSSLPNRTIALATVGYKPEIIRGKEVPYITDSDGKNPRPVPGDEVAEVKNQEIKK